MVKVKQVATAVFIGFWVLIAGPVLAQQSAWVQVEAQPTLTGAQARVRSYAAEFDDVAGFYLGGGWYGIVLGPYTQPDAENLLATLRRNGRIPGDSFIAFGDRFRQQFWPIGVAANTRPQPLPGGDAPGNLAEVLNAPTVRAPAPVPEPDAVIVAPDETAAQARQSESLLSKTERERLQTALKWAGFYDASIDGAFGRGTRASMQAWQEANSHPGTGVLTTAQRAELLTAYDAVLDGMNLTLTRDNAAGIEMLIPAGVVSFATYEPPFARFDAKGDLRGQVLLISQSGDQNRLFGLYEILQTLAAFPPDGPRTRTDTGFTIEGQDNRIHSYVQASLRNGEIKGFALIWPARDEQRRSRLLSEMIASFRPIEGVLDPAIATPSEDQAIDLVAGLEIRKPRLSRSGFYIDDRGTVLTTAEAVDGCARITINTDHTASVVHLDAVLGIAVLRPDDALAPMGVAAFQTGVPRLQTDIAVAGYPYGGVLIAPSLTFGRLADLRGLNGEEDIKRLALVTQDGDAGGPVFDNGGAVLGMLLPKRSVNGQVLPPEVSFAVDGDLITTSLAAAGITVSTTDSMAFMPPEILTSHAADQTVLVSCW